MAKEADYKAQLQELGIYARAFDAEIHTLCIMERELSRMMKAWKATAETGAAPDATHDLYEVIQKQRRDILAHRDALGLTPKAYKRLRKPDEEADKAGELTVNISGSDPSWGM